MVFIEREIRMIEAKIYNNDNYESGIYYFNNLIELTNYLTNNNVTLIWKRSI